MEIRKKLRIIYLIRELRSRAQPIGPLHSFWDTIFDLEALIQDKPTLLKMTEDEWIEYAENLLAKKGV